MIKIGLIGLGVVGSAFLDTFFKHKSLVKKRTSLDFKIEKVCDILPSKSQVAQRYNIPFTTDFREIIYDKEIDVVIELIGGIKPAREIIVESLKQSKKVITANKALLSYHGKRIIDLANRYHTRIGFEASVCGAIPIIKVVSESLVGCKIDRLYGILNGTTNYILWRMQEDRLEFLSALKEAQNKGFAERDPSLDIQGKDTLHKLCILSYLCFGVWPETDKVFCEGIEKITLLDILYAKELGYTIKLLAIAKKKTDKLELRIHPTLLPSQHSLSQVNTVFNGVYIYSYPAGPLFFLGEGAGGKPTSSSIMADLISIFNNSFNPSLTLDKKGFIIEDMKRISSRYYIRFMAKDKPGVLAQISKILADNNISIASVSQKERNRLKFVPIVMLTHEAQEENVSKAIKIIDSLPIIKPPSNLIRIEDL